MAKRNSVIFMGTPEFAVPCLERLLNDNFDVRLVVTQPDRPAGRGQKLQFSAVKDFATTHSLSVYQPSSLRGHPVMQQNILSVECDFLVVVAFGQILPAEILAHPKVAPLNVHASLLPAYRGAAPIPRALMEGEEKTGVSVQWMIEALDQGDILTQEICAIDETDTSESLHDKLKLIGARALSTTLQVFAKKQIVRRSQDARVGSYASKLHKAESALSFDQAAFFVHRTIMGLNPWPVAECQVASKLMKIYRSRLILRDESVEPGTILETSEGEIVVACRGGCIGILEVQLENRNRMPTSEFLKGHPLPKGLILGTAPRKQ